MSNLLESARERTVRAQREKFPKLFDQLEEKISLASGDGDTQILVYQEDMAEHGVLQVVKMYVNSYFFRLGFTVRDEDFFVVISW